MLAAMPADFPIRYRTRRCNAETGMLACGYARCIRYARSRASTFSFSMRCADEDRRGAVAPSNTQAMMRAEGQ
jgi:hypothetical protein